MTEAQLDTCPCESGRAFQDCCGPVIETRSAITAEALMRSRYAAFVLQDAAYLLDTWATETRPGEITFNPSQRWLGLKIRKTEAGGPSDDKGVVEFVARYKIDGRAHRLIETSQFSKVDGRWYYTTGEIS